MSFNLIPVTKTVARTRSHAPVTAAFLPKSGDLCVVFSPEFLEDAPLSVGDDVICAHDDENNSLLIALAPEDAKGGMRKIRKRQGFADAGYVIIPARNLPEVLVDVAFEKRKPMEWQHSGEHNGIIIYF